MPYRKSFRFALSAMITVVLCSLGSARPNAQVIEKLELVLGPPIYNTDRHDGLYYEVRGNVYDKTFVFDCNAAADPAIKRIGTYRLGVTFGDPPAEYIATCLVRLNDKRDLLWQGYFKFDPNEDGSEYSWAYSGIQTHSEISILTDFTLLSKSCFGGKLTVYFLN